MHRYGSLRSLLVCGLVVFGCSSEGSDTEPENDATTLKDKYERYFTIGAAVDSQSYMTHAELLSTHFNSLTTENEMKFDALHPGLDTYRYDTADAIVAFARENNMAVRGHALVWHRQVPSWMFRNSDGSEVTKEQLLDRLHDHISNVVGHFRGKVAAWDVVNEAIMNDGSLRTGDEGESDQQSRWYQIIGEDYIGAAFRYAHEADPDARLFYNDYYNYLPARRQGIYDLLKGLLDDGVPVHGVGLQCHLNIEPSSNPDHQSYYQTVENLEKSIELYASLGLEVHVTELDLSLYVAGNQYTEEDFYTLETFTEELQAKQAERYREFFSLFRKHRDAISNVTFWGIADDNTWLSEFSSGRKDFPLLFDVNHQPKPAFEAVMDF